MPHKRGHLNGAAPTDVVTKMRTVAPFIARQLGVQRVDVPPPRPVSGRRVDDERPRRGLRCVRLLLTSFVLR
jgi:hypothetical protein